MAVLSVAIKLSNFNETSSVAQSLSLQRYACVIRQLTSGEVWVQFNDGSQLVVQEGVSCITYASSPDGRITR